jgi:hypothetical protein
VIVIEDASQRLLRIYFLDIVLRKGESGCLDDLRREERLERLGSGESHEPCPSPPGGSANKQGRAGIVDRTGNHQQLAERAFVASNWSGRK